MTDDEYKALVEDDGKWEPADDVLETLGLGVLVLLTIAALLAFGAWFL